MDIRPGYKQTELGIIPEDWDVSSLSRLALLERGKFSARPRNDPKYFGGDIPFIQTGDITNSNGRISRYTQTLNTDGLRVSRLFPCNTLFFTIAANIGDIAFADFSVACPDSIVAILPRVHTDRVWLFFELLSRKASFEGIATQNAQLNINLEKLRPYLLPLPPLSEQRAIAEALGDVDALLLGLDRLIAKKRDLKQATMQQLLTGKTRLPGFSGEWEVKRLGEIARFRTGPFGSALHQSDYANDGIPIINPMHIVDGKIVPDISMTVSSKAARNLSDFMLSAGNIIIGRRGEMGRCAVVLAGQSGWICGTGSLIIKPLDFMCSEFLQRVISSPAVVKAISDSSVGTTMINLNQKSLFDIVLSLPSTLEQIAIAEVLSDMDAELMALEAQRDKTRLLKQGMMQELLTGRTRLV